MMRRVTRAARCLLACASVAACAAQGPGAPARGGRVESRDAHWRTIATRHYRIHYPADPRGGFLPFASEVASKIEGISAKVAELVGFEARGPIDVLVQDPLMEANGATVPLLRRPIVLLYRTPPEPDSQLDNFDSWVDLLVTHELVHLHHLMRPQNGAGPLDRLLPAGPLALKAPRYVTEGYATMLEGRITGSGRPHSAYRSAVIRQWALQGKLPGYGEVSGAEGYMGGAMAYLLGSAYLEWLERQFPDEPDILVTFWKHLASKKRRDFEKSFRAAFGVPPRDSYDRWRAEVTHDAVAWEQAFKKGGRALEGEIFARFDGGVTDLAVSPDGAKLMARVLSTESPGIRIWDLKGGEKKEDGSGRGGKKAGERGQKKKEGPPDPLEPADRKPEFEEPRPMATITRRDGALPRRAWWTGDDQITFELRHPNAEGVLRPSFRTLDLKAKRERRAPPGTAAPGAADGVFAKKDIGGVWNIVRRSPDGGETQLTNTTSAAWQPAPTPDGRTLYYARLTATGCEIRRLDLTADAAPQGPQAAAEQNEGRAADQAASETAPGADGAQARPGELGTPQAADAAPQTPRPAGTLALQDAMLTKGAVLSLPNAGSHLPPALAEIPEARDYSVWDSHKFGERSGLSYGPSSDSLQLGIGGSDVLGRLNWYAAASLGPAVGPRGAAVGVAYRGWRLSPSLQAFSSLEKPSAQRFVPVLGFDRERRGAELALAWERSGITRATAVPFAAFETIAPRGDARSGADRGMAGAMAAFSTSRSRGDWGAGLFASFQGAFGRTEYSDGPIAGAPGGPKGTDWRLFRLKAGVRLLTPSGPIALSAEEGRLGGDFGPFEIFHLGGQASGPVPASLEMNRVQQPALPAYLQAGDRMRVLRADYGFVVHAYCEQSAAWAAAGGRPDYQRAAGIELRLDELLAGLGRELLGLVPTFQLGLHRPLDGEMRGRAVYTVNVSLRL